MGHHCDFVDRIEIEYDYETERRYLERIVTASWKDYSLDVMRELEEDVTEDEIRFYYRNLELSTIGGYTVSFPGEIYRPRYSSQKVTQRLEDWGDTAWKANLWCNNNISKRSLDNILELYPNFIYCIMKMPSQDLKTTLVFDLLQTWKKHPECEGLIALGLYKLAMNKNLYKLTLPKRKQIIKWISQNINKEQINLDRLSLVNIQTIIKYKMTLEEYDDYQKTSGGHYVRGKYGTTRWCMSDVETWRYLKKKYPDSYSSYNITNYYYDYLSMCERAGHNIDDPYWKFPSDMYKSHDKVSEELKNMANAAEGLQGEYLKAIMKPLADKFDAVVDGYRIFIPTEYEDIKKQCDTLYQCLIRNNYVNKVIQQEEILVFVWKEDGTPIATAEVFYDKKLGQFYGDERGHSRGESCLPSDEVQAAFNKWLETFEPFKVKADRTKKYYKGFHSRDAFGVYHTSFGNFEFEVGKTYCTPFDDKIIAEKGGQGVVSTNMVFHFCDSIKEISNHYNPTCYAEVEPVGVVVEHQGALLSNKIKIVRELTDEEVKQILALENKYQELRTGGYM